SEKAGTPPIASTPRSMADRSQTSVSGSIDVASEVTWATIWIRIRSAQRCSNATMASMPRTPDCGSILVWLRIATVPKALQASTVRRARAIIWSRVIVGPGYLTVTIGQVRRNRDDASIAADPDVQSLQHRRAEAQYATATQDQIT